LIESVTVYPSIHLRHRTAPLLKERDQYLTHLLRKGFTAYRVRGDAAFLIHIIRVMKLTTMRNVELEEIIKAGKRWANYKGPLRKGGKPQTTPENFVRVAKGWLNYCGCLVLPPAPIWPFDRQIMEFKAFLKFERRLSSRTIIHYIDRTTLFLRWLSEKCDSLSTVSLVDVDEFILSKRRAGWSLRTIGTICTVLRAFFRFAEERGWCKPGLPQGILSPRVPKCTDAPKGPSWIDVRRLIRSINKKTPEALRARAMVLLYSVYGLRSSEVAGLRLDDFDWRSETFIVRRAKHGGVQQYPIQYEVGEAILEYLRKGRPHCESRHVFVGVRVPYRSLGPGGMWGVVGRRMKQMGIQSERFGPHSLRHACATHLLKKGSSLQEIASFLGHRNTKCVGVYAKYDKRSLHKVASFSLAGIL
jgi:integrase/recombinase XerD